MTKFKDLFLQDFGRNQLPQSSVQLKLKDHSISLLFDSKDRIQASAYSGPRDHWYSSLCFLLEGKTLQKAKLLSLKDWDQAFADEPFYWESREELEESVFFDPLEILRASLDLYRGREYLYEESSPLVCRCFGIREADLKDSAKAGMGCRSCLPDIKRLLAASSVLKGVHSYKGETRASWLLKIDAKLSLYPQALDWQMEIESFKKNMVVISYKKKVSQIEVEELGKDLQRFLGEEVDGDLAFFLRRSAQTL